MFTVRCEVCEVVPFTIEELDDVSEVHVVLQDDVPVDLHQRQSNEEDKVTRGSILSRPDGFPDREHVLVHQLFKDKNKKEVDILRKAVRQIRDILRQPLAQSKVNY